MPRYNKIKDKIFRACVEVEYYDREGKLKNEVFNSDAYPIIGTAKSMRTRWIDNKRRYYGTSDLVVIDKWEESVDLDWQRI